METYSNAASVLMHFEDFKLFKVAKTVCAFIAAGWKVTTAPGTAYFGSLGATVVLEIV